MALSSQTKETILVADDEASIRRILETRLSMIGYKVVTASDGKEALKLFKDYEPDLVVLDVMMPKLDGYGVCQELRKDSDVPIVMLTALGDVADRITGLELGADDYVVKPFIYRQKEQYQQSFEKDNLFPVLLISIRDLQDQLPVLILVLICEHLLLLYLHVSRVYIPKPLLKSLLY